VPVDSGSDASTDYFKATISGTHCAPQHDVSPSAMPTVLASSFPSNKKHPSRQLNNSAIVGARDFNAGEGNRQQQYKPDCDYCCGCILWWRSLAGFVRLLSTTDEASGREVDSVASLQDNRLTIETPGT
jgi:hypothetical protein